MSTISDAIQRALAKRWDEAQGDSFQPTDFISTTIPTLDHALDRPGIACGRLTVIKGQFATGKSTILHSLIAETQRRGGVAALVETERAIDLARMRIFGVDTDQLSHLLYTPDYMEQTIDLIGDIIEAARAEAPTVPVLIGWDSVAATPLKKEVEGESGDATIGGHARLLSQMLRKYTPVIAEQKIALVIVNQAREKIGGLPFADNSTMIGEKPLMYHASVALDVRRIGNITVSGKPPSGIKLEVRVAKNKLGAPYRTARVDLDFASGFDLGGAWLDLGLAVGAVKQKGAWYEAGEQRFQRKDMADVIPALAAAVQAATISPPIPAAIPAEALVVPA